MQSALGRSPLNTRKQPSKGASLYSVSGKNSAIWGSGRREDEPRKSKAPGTERNRLSIAHPKHVT